MREAINISTISTLEINRVEMSFPDPLNGIEADEIAIAQSAQSASSRIVASTPGKAHPTPSHQILFHIPNTLAYINLAATERLVGDIMTACNCLQGELPSIGDIPITTTILSTGRICTPWGLIIPCTSKGPQHSMAFPTDMPPLGQTTKRSS